MERWMAILSVSVLMGLAGCGGSTVEGEGGDGGSAGASGAAGTGGDAGTGGAAGTGGVGGSSGSGGIAGQGGGGAGGAGGSAGAGGTGGAPPPSPCPAQPPSGTCANEGMECWYGDDPRPYCRTRAVCYGGSWAMSGGVCEPMAPPETCPPDPDNVSSDLCDHGQAMTCDYGDGVVCGCTWSGAPPVDGGMPYYWECFQPPLGGCPPVVPNAGQPCSLPPGNSCNYGFMCGQVMMGCQNGLWVLEGESACS